MAVRQYIGARYTTKIYENTLDPSSPEWEANVSYEPMTLVTYNLSSYVSKKTVPATIGDPVSNPQYWACTGNYNAQVAYLTNQLAAVVNEGIYTDVLRVNDISDIDVTKSNVVWVFDCKDYTLDDTLHFDGVQNVSLVGNGCRILSDQTTPFNIFSFENSEHISVSGFIHKPENALATSLYDGALTYFTGTNDFTVHDCVGYDCTYLVCARTGNEYGDIHDNAVFIDNPGTWAAPTAFSAIISYASSHVNIHDNQVYGNLHDGIISVFGADSNYNIVANNYIDDTYHKAYDSQGITVDQGPSDTLVTGNEVRGCYYGIDIKAGTFNTKCSNNIVRGCKVGIADRRGEALNANASDGTIISDNEIVIVDYSLLTNQAALGGFDAYAILDETRYGCKIINNIIKYKNADSIIVCGISVNGRTVTTPTKYLDMFIIRGNSISLEYAFEATILQAHKDSRCVRLKDVTLATVADNDFRVTASSSADKTTIIYLDNSNRVNIVNNVLKAYFFETALVNGPAEPSGCLITGNYVINSKVENNNAQPRLMPFGWTSATVGTNYNFHTE